MSDTKRLWAFVYSELRCGRYLTKLSQDRREMIEAAEYALDTRKRINMVRSSRLAFLAGRQAERNFIKDLFE